MYPDRRPSRRLRLPRLAGAALLLAPILAACGGEGDSPEARVDAACDPRAAAKVVVTLGERMKQVALSAPDSLLRQQIEAQYGSLVTPALLEEWVAGAADVPGRSVSSPWPERIVVDSVVSTGTGECSAYGTVVYVTSVEVAHGGAAAEVPVRAVLTHDGEWRVSAFDSHDADGPAEFLAPGTDTVPAAPAAPAPEPAAAPPVARPADGAAIGADPADVIRAYYAAIDARDFRRAYGLWARGGEASGKRYDEFVAGFAQTASAAVEIGDPGQVEGAAGSRYIEIPVVVRAFTTDGSAQRFVGSYTLRRTVVDGATPAQQRWQLYSAKIEPAT